jgi:hypothetical protein
VGDERPVSEQALDLFVYGPIGLAIYVRDTAPSFLKLFVARGRAVVDDQRKAVEGQLGQARSVGQVASAYGGPQVWRLVADRVAQARTRAEEAIEALGTLTGTAEPPAATGTRSEPLLSVRLSDGDEAGADAGLAIPDYDELSASQVVDRLEGLASDELEAIREYEQSHRARNTVLGKIEQLTPPVG